MSDTNKLRLWHTARARFDKADGEAWINYIRWSRLSQLTELVSLDKGLNEVLVTPDHNDAAHWKYIVLNDAYHTGFFTTVDFVLNNMLSHTSFHLLAVSVNPTENCNLIEIDNYDFLGYDLLDQYYDTSALTNCSGFDKAFLPSDLNTLGLIDHYDKALEINKRLEEVYPDEEHADTNVIAIWRHKIIGRV